MTLFAYDTYKYNRDYNDLKSWLNILIVNRIYFIKIYNKFYSTNKSTPIISLWDLIDFKNRITDINSYQGLLKDKENSEFKFGNAKLYPAYSEYDKFEDICDWKTKIRQIIKEKLLPGVIYDIAMLGHDILNEKYITYSKYFFINKESNINTVIIGIEGNIFVNSLSVNSEDIEAAENENDLELGMRLIIFLIRSVSFDTKVIKLVNKDLLKNNNKKMIKDNNKKELLKLKNNILIALFNILPNSNLLKDFGSLINDSYINKSGISGSLYQFNKVKILIHKMNTNKVEDIVYKQGEEYFRFTDINISSTEIKDIEFYRTILNTTIKYVNKNIKYIDTKIESKHRWSILESTIWEISYLGFLSIMTGVGASCILSGKVSDVAGLSMDTWKEWMIKRQAGQWFRRVWDIFQRVSLKARWFGRTEP